MPELPDVELFRGYSEQALDLNITSVEIQMTKLLKTPEDELVSYLTGKKLMATARHGKYLFFKTKDVKKISKNKLKELFDIMLKVLNDAINCHVDPEELPAEYLLGRRKEGASCGICDGRIKSIVVNNRGGYYCQKHQR